MRSVPASTDRNIRCRACYALRFEHVAHWAGRECFDAFTSSLLYSRHQSHTIIAEEGEKAAQGFGTAFLYRDFRPAWQEGVKLSKQWSLYRQRYCACMYSETERYAKELEKACAEVPMHAPRIRRVLCPPIDSDSAKV